MKTTNRRNLFILVFSLLVVMLGFGMVIPVFPFLITKLGASGSALGVLVATAALTEFLFGPIWGSISDRVGRKPILMIGMFGYALAMFLFGIADKLWMLLVFRALSGILSSATITTTGNTDSRSPRTPSVRSVCRSANSTQRGSLPFIDLLVGFAPSLVSACRIRA